MDRKELLRLLASMQPERQDALSDDEFEAIVNAFCAGCPDPVRTRWLLLDCLEPLSDEELVDWALRMPPNA